MANNRTERISAFPVTRWSVVASAAAGSELSLDELCRQYWQPVYAVARGTGHDVEVAKDLTQGFFAKLLAKGWLGSVDQEKGRFRTFLITALKRHMINEWHCERAAKRGGELKPVPFDTRLAERICGGAGAHYLTPAQLFDKCWALTLIETALARIEHEYLDAGRNEEFEALKPCLTASRGEIDYGCLAVRLGLTDGAARVAVHRLRKRYRALFREEIARTLCNDEDIEEEMQALLQALGR